MACSFTWEKRLAPLVVAGLDEAGRGTLAGPLVAAAFTFSRLSTPAGLNDSKLLTPARREKLCIQLTSGKFGRWALAIITPTTIDEINILNATHLAMKTSLQNLHGIQHALIDGLPIKNLPLPQTALIQGDKISFSIAAASVIAKVTRDRLMADLDHLYPDYKFSQHKGYPTPQHLKILKKLGPCPAHRLSFKPVKNCLQTHPPLPKDTTTSAHAPNSR